MEHVYTWKDLGGWNGLKSYTNTETAKEDVEEQWREQFVEETESDVEETESSIQPTKKQETRITFRNNGGRPKKYATPEEAALARIKQTAESHRRTRETLAKIKAQQSPQQRQIIKYLQEHVIKNTKLLDLIYNRLQSRLALQNETLEF
jgi:succinate dehydrogenase/fumarate reductase flavoprotein subunit